MEIRKVVKGRSGLLLAKTEYYQKVSLISRDSKVRAGDFVKAELIRDEETYAVYKCATIPENRMVIVVESPLSGSCSATYYWNGQEESTRYFKTEEIENSYVEEFTEHSSVCTRRGYTSGGNWDILLINKGKEKNVLTIFIKSKFNHFVLEELGVWNLHANGPRFYCEDSLRTYAEFVEAWQNYDHRGFRDLVSQFGTWEPGHEGMTSKETSVTEWDVLVPHLAAWTAFNRMVRDNRQYIYNNHPDGVWGYCIPMGGGVSHHYCLYPLLDKAVVFFRSVADITKDRVMEFLAKNKSIFPSLKS